MLTLQGPSGSVASVAFSPDGKRLASRSWQGRPSEVKVWDAQTGKELLSIDQSGGPGWWRNVVFSPDGKRLASGQKQWDTETGKEIHSIKAAGIVAFSPDGMRLAFGRSVWDAAKEVFVANGVRILDAEIDEELLVLMGHGDSVLSIASSPDGKRLASAFEYGAVKVWDAESGEEMLTFVHAASIGTFATSSERRSHNIAFSRDGHRLSSTFWDGTVKIFDATPLPESRSWKIIAVYSRNLKRIPVPSSNDPIVTYTGASESNEI